MGRSTPTVAVLALVTLAAALAVAPESAGRQRAAVLVPDPATYRLGYVSGDRPTLAAAEPGGTASAVPAGAPGVAAADPDLRGDTLVWVTPRPGGGSDLMVRPAGGAARLLTDDPAVDRQPALSPDGRRVAFTSDRAGSADIWVVDVTGAGLARRTDHPGEDTAPAFSPDGRSIAFSSTRDDPAGDLYTVAAGGGAATRLTADPAADTDPAYSPDGRRLAFTTSRFTVGPGAATAVATMAVNGGAVTRAVPAPWDSAQPAWAPDGRRLAFVSRRLDPAGNVYVVDGSTVSAVATDRLRAESDPVFVGAQVLHTTVAAEPSDDVWSADATGGDRRDLTGRTGADENAPAFSADGLRLAYSAGQPDGGQRIVVADADGRNPRTLAPAGTVALDRDTDPTFSPDASQLAFTRQPADPAAPSRVLVVRTSDGAQVGELPVPAHLLGRDAEPAWSPDGTRIAVSRSSVLRASRVDPPRLERPQVPGTTFSGPKTVSTPEIPATPDIIFFLDQTGSMDGVIDRLKVTIVQVAAEVRAEQPNARFALIAYGAPANIGANRYYRRLVDLTDNVGALTSALEALGTDAGGEEGWYNAIVQALAGGDNERVHLRPDSSPIVVVIGDAPSTGNQRHPSTGDDVTKQEVVALMSGDALRAKLVAVPVEGTAEAGLNFDVDGNGTGEASEIAGATRGVVTATTTPDGVADAIVGGISSTLVTVVPQVGPCPEGVTVTFDPPSAPVESGQRATFTERITLAPSVAPGTVLRCSVQFDVGSPVPVDEVRQDITIRAVPGDRPFVRVDDVTATARRADGVAVTYQATATDPSGRPLPAPSCTPPSGTVFPIGQTVVTCTASVGGGPVGQDIAVITVLGPDRGAGDRIWVARVASRTADAVTFGDQVDLSARVPGPCRARVSDRAPAWSPDSGRLAFTDGGGQVRGLCVVAAADGALARVPLSATDQGVRNVEDPAWAPDGSRIAVALRDRDVETPPGSPSASPPVSPSASSSEFPEGPQLLAVADPNRPAIIVTVPAAGGAPTTVIATIGSAAQPAFQPVPERDLTIAVSVGNQPAFVGGAVMPVTVTVRNASTRPASNAWVALDLPAALQPATNVDSRCNTAGTVCQLGALGVNDQVRLTLTLPPRAALVGTVTARLTAAVGDRAPATRRASAAVVVRQPSLSVSPPIGPPGFVTQARGVDFPPGATVRLTWDIGISVSRNTVTVQPDGSFRLPQLVMRKDRLGPRHLSATPAAGATFGPVRTAKPFLVVPRGQDPPTFLGRG